jgi:AGZA family xanthine/uracil permease-like MFS transporter
MLERLFHVRELGSTPAREALGGFTTFLTMSYIVVVNPIFLTAAGMPLEGAIAATCVSAGLATLLMAFLANYPIALAPGMGLNAFFAYNLCLGAKVPWPTALGIVFWSGALFVLLTVSGLRAVLVRAIPRAVTAGAAVGIGLFIAFIGLEQGGLVRADPNTLVTLGDLHSTPARIALFGLALALALAAAGWSTALFWGTVAALGAALWTGATVVPESWVSWPTFEFPGARIDLWGALRIEYLPLILVNLFLAFFDTLGTLLAVAHEAGLVRDGKLPRLERALAADALGMVGGALLGTSTVTSYVESGAGVGVGARTGLASVVTGILLLGSLFLTPLLTGLAAGVGLEPVTTPALVLVGILMVRTVREIDWEDLTEAAPAFLTALLMPLTFNIAHGLAAGIVGYVLVKVAARRGREVHPLLLALAVLVVLRYALLPG